MSKSRTNPCSTVLVSVSALFLSALFLSALFLAACGSRIDTGRNGIPVAQPVDQSESPEQTNGPNVVPGQVVPCFKRTTKDIPENLAKLCSETIKPNASYKELYPILCEEGRLVAILNSPKCGWDGTPSTLKRFKTLYSMSTDPTQNYDDIHSTVIHAPVPLANVLKSFRLAFENYPEFKLQGYQWIEGTREQRNLTGKTWEQGVEYRFRADKGLYEIGYQGINQLYQMSPTLFVHLNRATGDYERVAAFSQIAMYHQLADNTTMIIKLEHRTITSTGLYNIAKVNASELLVDFMKKGYSNAIKP
jgi:hypothetical protein